jgi:choline dehydrogenase-like flavoprotein
VADRIPSCLKVSLDSLATRVLFDEKGAAVGVEYLKGARLYHAHPDYSSEPGVRCEVRARREVILAGGAFNTPQLLMLSGIGPAEHLRAHGIPVRVDLAGVGTNLQDRYEVAVVNRMARPWEVLKGARFSTDDPVYRTWREFRKGAYIANGAAVAVARSSVKKRSAPPDIFCMALVGRFAGYYPGYSEELAKHDDILTWTILKAHTKNHAGTVRLRSADPRDMPVIDFHYFEEGDDVAGDDMRSVIEAIKFVRRLAAPLVERGLIAREELPGASRQDDAALAAYIRNNAWGHHASCTCAIGKPSEKGVLDSALAVHGVHRLRVVDASVFPKIPGFFLASAVYMIAEKAADMILNDAARLT